MKVGCRKMKPEVGQSIRGKGPLKVDQASVILHSPVLVEKQMAQARYLQEYQTAD
jgi:hypothetical protein